MIVLTLAGFQIESFLRQPGVIGLVLLGLTLTLVPLAIGLASKRFLVGELSRSDSLQSLPKS
jgi:hypothetical protein